MCTYHRSIRRTLRHRLNKNHQGKSIANATLALIAAQCPACLKETR